MRPSALTPRSVAVASEHELSSRRAGRSRTRVGAAKTPRDAARRACRVWRFVRAARSRDEQRGTSRMQGTSWREMRDRGTVHRGTVHCGTVHCGTVHCGTVCCAKIAPKSHRILRRRVAVPLRGRTRIDVWPSPSPPQSGTRSTDSSTNVVRTSVYLGVGASPSYSLRSTFARSARRRTRARRPGVS